MTSDPAACNEASSFSLKESKSPMRIFGVKPNFRQWRAPPSAAISKSLSRIAWRAESGSFKIPFAKMTARFLVACDKEKSLLYAGGGFWLSWLQFLRRYYPGQVHGSRAFSPPLSLVYPDSPSRIRLLLSVYIGISKYVKSRCYRTRRFHSCLS